MTDAAFNDRLHAVYESRSTNELIDQYDQWAETYDADLLHADYRLPTVGACMVARHVRANEAEILEAGVGTGQVGEWLAILGFQNLTGFDLSENMLQRACVKNVYKRLHRIDMLRTLQFRDKAFDAAIAIGIFALGHVPPNALDELIRVTRPKGQIIFSTSITAYVESGFKERQAALEGDGRWQLMDQTDAFVMYPSIDSAADLMGRVFVYQVL